MFKKNSERDREKETRLIKNLLSAAAARPEENFSISPFFLPRLRQSAVSRSSYEFMIGQIAWQMLPAVVLIMAILCSWAGIETIRVSRAKEAALARMVESENRWPDVLAAAWLLGGQAGESR